MNAELFLRFQNAADDALLEEAMERPARSARRNNIRYLGLAAAACVCLVAGLALWRGGSRAKSAAPMAAPVAGAAYADSAAQNENSLDLAPEGAAAAAEPVPAAGAEPNIMMTLANPVRESSAEELAELGYAIPLPAAASDALYTLIDMGDGTEPLAQASFTLGDQEYTYRAQKTAAAEDISGLYYDWDESYSWSVGTLQLELRRSGEVSWVGWYAPEEGVQSCLSGESESEALLDTARRIAGDLGHDFAVAPAGAQDVRCSVFELDGKTVAETSFALEGVRWTYRTAATGALQLEDISGLADGAFARSGEGEVSWCPAWTYWNAGADGKILWMDIVPGLVYSLGCDTGADGAALLDMANALFVPAQGDAG